MTDNVVIRSRATFARSAILIALGLLSLTSPALSAAKPNILLILADDLGYSDLGCYGSAIQTPNLDRLAENGLRFSQFYNAGRGCPSRASLLTGLYPHQAGVGHMLEETGFPGYGTQLRADAATIPEVLKEAGYGTFMTGEWHLGRSDAASPTARGFDHFYGVWGSTESYFSVPPRANVYLDNRIVNPAGETPTNHLHPDQDWYTTEVFTDYALSFIDEHLNEHPSQPFFGYLAYNAPHFPLHAKSEDTAKYRWRFRDTGWGTRRQQRFERLKSAGLIPEKTVLPKPDAPDWNSLSDGVKDELDLKFARYCAIIDRLDQNIGRLIRHLEAKEVLGNTLIVFLSDNGSSREGGAFGFGDHNVNPSNHDEWVRQEGPSSSLGRAWANVANTPFRGYKREAYEGGIATPCIVHWPGGHVRKGITHQVSHVMDIMPTLLQVAGVSPPEKAATEPIPPMEGKSLFPVLRGGSIGSRTLCWEHEGNRAVRRGDWKLVARNGLPWEVYHLSMDRTETENLLYAQPVAASLSAEWNAWAKRVGVLPWETVRNRLVEIRQRRLNPGARTH